jgi:hypothetical protein
MSCPHPKSDIQTSSRQLNDETRQVEHTCGRCGTLLQTTTEEVPQWAA